MKRYANLIPYAIQRRRMMVQHLRAWLLAWGCIIMVGGVVVRERSMATTALAKKFETLDPDCKTLRSTVQKTAEFRLKLERLQKQENWLESLEQAELPLIVLAAIHQGLASLSGQIEVDRLHFESTLPLSQLPRATGQAKTPVAGTPSIPEPNANVGRVSISGTSVDDSIVSSFISQLEQSGLFHSVELISLQGQEASKRQFQLECRIQTQFDQLQQWTQRVALTKG